ncbi:MAG: hypothetical protein WBP22_03610 [Candidatus Saccharimonas sp.]
MMKLFKQYIGSPNRAKADDHAYFLYKKNRGDVDICDLCNIETSASKIIAEYPLFMVITNAFPYAIWEGGLLNEHLMLVPKRHTESIATFTPEENAEFLQLLSEYDQQGYSYYGRAAGSPYKSIPHQHTHLMQVGTPITRQIYNRRPYINFFK